MTPKRMFLTKGYGFHKNQLQSFELALRDGNIEICNLVNVSSIFPPDCKIISKDEGIKLLKSGKITYVVMSRNSTNEPNRLITSSIGIAIPKNKSYGYISEHHSFGETLQIAGDYAEDLAATMLATTLGIDFDPDKDWNERKQEYKMSGKFVKTKNITQSARGNKNGLWTTTIAAAVFICE